MFLSKSNASSCLVSPVMSSLQTCTHYYFRLQLRMIPINVQSTYFVLRVCVCHCIELFANMGVWAGKPKCKRGSVQ